jgi:hypothetical protein
VTREDEVKRERVKRVSRPSPEKKEHPHRRPVVTMRTRLIGKRGAKRAKRSSTFIVTSVEYRIILHGLWTLHDGHYEHHLSSMRTTPSQLTPPLSRWKIPGETRDQTGQLLNWIGLFRAYRCKSSFHQIDDDVTCNIHTTLATINPSFPGP